MGLFGTTVINREETKYVPYDKNVTINERRAPTDDSVRLLKEIQDKAVENIISSFVIKSNHLNAACLFFEMDYCMGFSYKMCAKFEINGKEHVVEMTVERMDKVLTYDGYNDLFEQFITFLHEAYAKEITKELLDMRRDLVYKSFKDFTPRH